MVTTGTVDTNTVGTYTVTYTSTDDSGNVGTATRTVTVEDTTDPVITLLNNTAQYNTVEFGGTYSEQGATADGNETVTTTGTVDTTTVGQYTITYSATDASGNEGTATRMVTVVDTTAPVITLSGSATVTIVKGSTYTDAGATATDNYDTSVTVVTTGTVDTNTVGTYTITYTASDSSGNTALPVTRTVNVQNPNVRFSATSGGSVFRNVDLPMSVWTSNSQSTQYPIQSNSNKVRLLFNVPVTKDTNAGLPYIKENQSSTQYTATFNTLTNNGNVLDLTFPSFNPAGNNYIYIPKDYLTYDDGTSTTASVVTTTRKVLWVG